MKTTTYTFNELDEAGKERARDWYRSAGIDYDWWELVIEAYKEVGASIGIAEMNVFYGNDVRIEGLYRYRPGWRKALREVAPGDTRSSIEAIGERLQNAQRVAFYRLTATCTARSISTDSDAIREALEDFAHLIYTALEREYDWLQADEQIDESILSNGYEFDARGNII